jgi:tight adherence protein C
MMEPQTLLVAALTFMSVLCLGGAAISAGIARRHALTVRLQGVKAGPTGIPLDPPAPFGIRLIKGIGNLASKGPSSDLRRRLIRAGFHGRAAASVFVGTQLLGLLAGFAVTAAAMWFLEMPWSAKVLFTICGTGLGFFLPNLYLNARSRNRSLEVRRHLPDMVDLLEICVSGGMGLDMAWNAVSDEIYGVCPLLADEMALTNLELHLGEDRGAAIRHMAERTGAEELSSLVAVLVQSQRFGTSVSDALRTFAAGLRELRSQRAEESAEKMSVQMLFPMILFIFPVVIVVAVGPAIIRLADVLGIGSY